MFFSFFNPENATCDYPPSILITLLDANLGYKAPGPHKFILELTLSSEIDTEIMALTTQQNYSNFDAACYWIRQNNGTAFELIDFLPYCFNTNFIVADTWQPWIEAALKAEVAQSEGNSTKVNLLAIILPIVGVAVLVLIGIPTNMKESYLIYFPGAVFITLKARRYTKNAQIIAKKMEEDQKASFNIAYSELILGSLIGKGNFGEGRLFFIFRQIIKSLLVYAGEYHGTEVAIKKLMNQKMDATSLEQFSTEIATMINLKHPNILLFMGACTGKVHVSFSFF